MSRGSSPFDSHQPYQIAPQGSHDDDDVAIDDNNSSNAFQSDGDGGLSGIFRSPPCCGGGDGSDDRQQRPASGESHGDVATSTNLHDFVRRLRDRWRTYDSLETVDRRHQLGASSPVDVISAAKKRMSCPPPPSPLRQASSFDSSRDIPVISNDEVVLPGSELQKEMAEWQSKTLERHDDECVICMEGFDPTNPRMPTKCGCGENKTYFHLPCLYQWIEQSRECPSCRQRLKWEEF
jgi:hypothetical protein